MRQNASYDSILSYHYKKVIAASLQKKRIMQNLKRVRGKMKDPVLSK